MNLFRKISTIVFALALLVGALGVPAAPAHADTTIITITNQTEVQWNGWSWPTVHQYTCQPFQQGFFCHVHIENNDANNYAGEAITINYSDSRPSGWNYKWAYSSYAVGQFQYGANPNIETPISVGFSDGTTAVGLGHQEDSGTFQWGGSSYYVKLNFTTGRNIGFWDFDFVLVPNSDSLAHPYPWETPVDVYIDSTEAGVDNVNVPTWEANLYGYFNDVNAVLAKNTPKELYYNGSITIRDTPQQVFHYDVLTCDNLWTTDSGYKILFSHNDGGLTSENVDLGWTPNVDCDGFSTAVVNTKMLEYDEWMPPSTSEADAAITRDGRCYDTNNFRNECGEYWNMVQTIMHEFVHNYGGYAIETRQYIDVVDPTRADAPTVNIMESSSSGVETDDWWRGDTFGGSYKQPNLNNDPMASIRANIDSYTSAAEIRSKMTLTNLSAKFLGQDELISYRGQMHITAGNSPSCTDEILPDFRYLTVTQRNGGGVGISGITVKAWAVAVGNTTGIYYANYDGSQTTNANGQVTFDFFGWQSFVCRGLTTDNLYIILKSYDSAGNQYGDPQIVSGYNLELAAFDGMVDTFYVDMTKKPDTIYTVDATGIGASSGWTRSDGTTGGSYIIAGDNNLNQSYRGIIDFDTSLLPDNAVIDSASLQLTKASFTGSIQGWGPTEHVNSVTVQIGNPCIGACSTLEASDYTAILGTVGYACAAQVPPCGNMTTTTDFIGSLTNISLTGHTNIRLRFNTPTDSDGINDYTSWYKNTAGGGTPPILTITYHIP